MGDGVISTMLLPDGSIEKRFSDGNIEIIKPGGTVIFKHTDGTTVTTDPDGTTMTKYPDGTMIETLPDGTTIKTLPDGTIITTTPDGKIIKTLPEENDSSFGKIKLNSVVASLSGWGLTSSRSLKDKPAILTRNAFRKLDEDKDSRRFKRWNGGSFQKNGHDCDSWIGPEETPKNSFQLLEFIKKRISGHETKN